MQIVTSIDADAFLSSFLFSQMRQIQSSFVKVLT